MNLKNGGFFKETSVSVAEELLESKDTALITQGDKMFKVFSRPQIDLKTS
jgi:tRNA uridine 5-carboxymethylaminomethyl modification enzyme